MPIIAYELEEEGLAGSDTTEDGIIRSSPPPVIRSLSDRWKCLQCAILNDPPMRYCHKCYEV